MGRRTKVFALDQKLSKCRTTSRCIRPHIDEVFDATTRWLRVVRPWLDDKSCRVSDVRFGSIADIAASLTNVCFTPKSGYWNSVSKCPLCAKSGHWNSAAKSAFGARNRKK